MIRAGSLCHWALLMWVPDREAMDPKGSIPRPRSKHWGRSRSQHPVKCPPDIEALSWARSWLPVRALDRKRHTLAAPGGDAGERFTGTYHIAGSLHMLSCNSLTRCLSAATLDKLGTRGTEGFRALPKEHVLKSTFNYRSKSKTLNLSFYHFATELLEPSYPEWHTII